MVEIPEPGSTYYSIQDVPHGQVREIWYHSEVTGSWRHALVYLPPGYDTSAEDALPGALPAARRRRGRDRLDPPGSRQFHPRQPDRGRRKRKPMIVVMAYGYARRAGAAPPDPNAAMGSPEMHEGHAGDDGRPSRMT